MKSQNPSRKSTKRNRMKIAYEWMGMLDRWINTEGARIEKLKEMPEGYRHGGPLAESKPLIDDIESAKERQKDLLRTRRFYEATLKVLKNGYRSDNKKHIKPQGSGYRYFSSYRYVLKKGGVHA